jgi:hypothetical protein
MKYIGFYDISYFNDFTVGWFDPQFFVIRQFLYFALIMGAYFYIHHKSGTEHLFNYLLNFVMCFAFIPFAYDMLAFVQDITIQHFWQSTIWTFYVFVGLSTFFLATVLITDIFDKNRDLAIFTPRMATFLFGFNILWTYLYFCQFIIVLYGNVPIDTFTLSVRFNQPWLLYQALALILHFIIPALFLFSKKSKTKNNNILIASYSTLMACVLDFMCYFVPPFAKEGISIYEYTYFIVGFLFFIILFINSLQKTRDIS